MASHHIRNWFKEKIEQLAGVPYQETDGVLRSQKGLPELWATVEYDLGSTQRLSIGRPYLEREYGTGTVLFLLKAGKGPEDALRVAKSFRDAAMLLYQEDITEDDTGITGTVRFENIGPANSEPYEDGNWLVCSVACVYTYESVRGAGSAA
jgi:hypothetical protein